ncbi:MAG TPA: HIT domain-containing protein, partial [Actinomycetota bacterium]|nr:HIT domain-containing protein [Actinomycetota bacterium]
AGDDEGKLIVARADLAFAMLNGFPYNPGHLLVAPVRHVAEFEELTPEEHAASSALLGRGLAALKRVSEPHGFNVGMNLGRVAGAGVPGHAHWHVVPRWNGDTNFMAAVGETRVLPEALEETYRKLQAVW